ncbi:MAG: SDR family oxidoreductase, partial [Xanthobacteraceae bacterium]
SQLGKRDGVNVNIIHPGATETERFYQLLEQRSKASGKSVEQLKQEATAKDGLRRLGRPADISALVLFLCSEKARLAQLLGTIEHTTMPGHPHSFHYSPSLRRILG